MAEADQTDAIAAHYAHGDIGAAILGALRRTGINLDALGG